MTRTLPARMRPTPPGIKPQPVTQNSQQSQYNYNNPQLSSQQLPHPPPFHGSQTMKIPTSSQTFKQSHSQLNPPSYYSTFHSEQSQQRLEQPHHFYYSNTQQQLSQQSQQNHQQRPRPHFYSTNSASQQGNSVSARSAQESSQQSQPQFQSSPVKFYRQTPSQINYKVASVHHNGTISQQPQPQPPTTSNSTSSSCNSSTGSPGCNLNPGTTGCTTVTMRSRPPSASTRTPAASNSSVSNRRNAVYVKDRDSSLVKEVTPEAVVNATKSKPPLPSASDSTGTSSNSGGIEFD